jgi:hypothetical protein
MLSLSSGAPGCGKTSQHFFLSTVLPNSKYLCLEYKDIELLENSGVDYTIIEKFDDNFMSDPIATLAALELAIHEITHSNKWKNVVVDGVSDIRKFAKDEWIYKDNQDRVRKQLKPREGISGDNLAAWQDINDRVQQLLQPLINWGNVTRSNVFFTAQLKDKYSGKQKVGKEINIGEWCEYKVDAKFEFSRPDLERYSTRITKLPKWAKDTGVYEIDILPNGFLALLAERGLIK